MSKSITNYELRLPSAVKNYEWASFRPEGPSHNSIGHSPMIEEQSQFKALKARHPPLVNYELRITNYELRMGIRQA
jgi:hypothetical protein